MNFLATLAKLPLGWTVACIAMSYIVIVLKRCDAIQEARLNDMKEQLAKLQELASKLGAI